MPTFHRSVENNTIIIGVEVSIADGQPGHRFAAKVDTGATSTAVTSRVIQQLGSPAPIGRETFGTAGPESLEADVYGLHVAVPVDTQPVYLVGGLLAVAELPPDYQSSTHDVLLGMDLLKRFHITMWSGNFIMSN